MNTFNEKKSKKVNSLKQKLILDGSWAFFGKAVTGVGAIFIAGLLSRLMMPAELGEYFLSQSFAYFIGMSICLGLDQSSIKLLSESISLDKPENIEGIILKTLSIVLSLSVFVAILFWLIIGPFLAKNIFHSDTFLEIIPFISLWIASLGLQKLVGEMLRGFHDIRAATLFCGTLFGGVVDVCLYLFILIICLISFGAIELKVALTISMLVSWTSLIAALFMLWRKVRQLKVSKKTYFSFKRLIYSGLPIWVSSISTLSMVHADLWIIGAFRSKEELAIYGAVTRLVKFITTTIVVVEEVVPPLIAQLNVQNKKEDMEWSLRTTSAVATFISIPIFIIFIFLGNYIITMVYGDFYTAGFFVLVVLSMAHLINVWVGACGYTLTMTGHGKILMYIAFLTALLAIICATIVVAPYGINGVATVMALTVVIQQLIVLFNAHKYCGVWTYASFDYGFKAINSVVRHAIGRK